MQKYNLIWNIVIPTKKKLLVFIRLHIFLSGGSFVFDVNDCLVGHLLPFFGFLFLTRHTRHGSNHILLAQVDEFHTLGGTTKHAERIHMETNGDAGAVDNHEVVFVGNPLNGNQSARFLGDVEGFDTLSTTVVMR